MFQMEFIDISLILYKFICIILCFPNLVRKINGESNSKHIVAFSIQFVACFLALKFWNVKVKKKPCQPLERNSRPQVLCKKGVLRNFGKFTGKHLCQSLFFNKVAGLLLKKRLWHRCFPVNFPKFLRAPFLTEHPPGGCCCIDKFE